MTDRSDTIGPMARTVTDAAHLLQAMVPGGEGQVSYTDSLRVGALAGQCIIFPQNLSNIDDVSKGIAVAQFVASQLMHRTRHSIWATTKESVLKRLFGPWKSLERMSSASMPT